MLVLGIETSCDETSCAIVQNGTKVLSNIVSSSLDFHSKYGGVIPEIASRAHLETINFVTGEALRTARVSFKDVSLIAYTQNPGLFGSLIVGITFAKALGFALSKPIVAVDHLKAHLYAPWLDGYKPKFPLLGLVISGGHTSLYRIDGFEKCKLIGKTLDDAAGEAFDKAAKIMDLGYPGGPVIDRLAKNGNSRKIRFLCEGPKDSWDFSFSGIKTALLYKINDKKFRGTNSVNDICASFQAAIIDTVARKTFSALEKNRIKNLVIGGGVAANSYLREAFLKLGKEKSVKVFIPPLSLCTDNAALVAGLGYRLRWVKSGGLYD